MKTQPSHIHKHKKTAKTNSEKLEQWEIFSNPRHSPRTKLLLRPVKKSWVQANGFILELMILEIMKHSNIAMEKILSQFKIHHGGPPLIQKALVPIVYEHIFIQIFTMENGLILIVQVDSCQFVRQLFSCIYLTTLSWWI